MRFKQYLKEIQDNDYEPDEKDFLVKVKDITKWMQSMHEDPKWAIKGHDGSLHFGKHLHLDEIGLRSGHLPFRVDSCFGTIDFSYNEEVTSLEGLPPTTPSDVKLSGCHNLKSLEFVPRRIGGHLRIENSGITSLEGINDHIEAIGGWLIISHETIKSGGIGVLLFDDFTGFKFSASPTDYTADWVRIINRYVDKPDGVFDCQAELIEKGFEEHAKI